MSRHQFGSPEDRPFFIVVGTTMTLGLVASAVIPGAEELLNLVVGGLALLLLAGAGLYGLGVLIQTAMWENRLTQEIQRPIDPSWDTE